MVITLKPRVSSCDIQVFSTYKTCLPLDMPQVFGIVEIIGKCFCQCQYVSITFGRHLYLLELLLLAQRIK